MRPTSKEEKIISIDPGSDSNIVNMEIVSSKSCTSEEVLVQSLFMNAFPNIQLSLQLQHHNQEALPPEVATRLVLVGIAW